MIQQLLDKLTKDLKDLNIGRDQVEGAVGLVMQIAQENLNKEQFKKLSQSLGKGFEDLLSKAPDLSNPGQAAQGLAGMMGNMLSAIGGSSKAGGALSKLMRGLDQLGISLAIMPRVIASILEFIDKNLGSDMRRELASILENQNASSQDSDEGEEDDEDEAGSEDEEEEEDEEED